MFNFIESIAQFLIYVWCFAVGGFALFYIMEGIFAICDYFTGRHVYRG